MSERESEPIQSEPAEADTREKLPELLARIRANAIARVREVEVPDERALEAEDDLVTVGQTWL